MCLLRNEESLFEGHRALHCDSRELHVQSEGRVACRRRHSQVLQRGHAPHTCIRHEAFPGVMVVFNKHRLEYCRLKGPEDRQAA